MQQGSIGTNGESTYMVHISLNTKPDIISKSDVRFDITCLSFPDHMPFSLHQTKIHHSKQTTRRLCFKVRNLIKCQIYQIPTPRQQSKYNKFAKARTIALSPTIHNAFHLQNKASPHARSEAYVHHPTTGCHNPEDHCIGVFENLLVLRHLETGHIDRISLASLCPLRPCNRHTHTISDIFCTI